MEAASRVYFPLPDLSRKIERDSARRVITTNMVSEMFFPGQEVSLLFFCFNHIYLSSTISGTMSLLQPTTIEAKPQFSSLCFSRAKSKSLLPKSKNLVSGLSPSASGKSLFLNLVLWKNKQYTKLANSMLYPIQFFRGYIRFFVHCNCILM